MRIKNLTGEQRDTTFVFVTPDLMTFDGPVDPAAERRIVSNNQAPPSKQSPRPGQSAASSFDFGTQIDLDANGDWEVTGGSLGQTNLYSGTTGQVIGWVGCTFG